MKRFLNVLFLVGVLLYALCIAYFPDYSMSQMVSAILFGLCVLALLLINTDRGERRFGV